MSDSIRRHSQPFVSLVCEGYSRNNESCGVKAGAMVAICGTLGWWDDGMAGALGGMEKGKGSTAWVFWGLLAMHPIISRL